ncbi:uncharacterized protein LOC116655866 [Drosophila ananassae]|uniref:uncharacterized protein LOC116655866 n=1 Tax=Drosophila ananassae TaxID=7217 RepID=UPI000177CBD4|nr:uncharacterized protein LOC116655866 [Drosophila ananassae]
MNFATSSILLLLGLVLGAVNAQPPTREETSRDKACGPGRYYSEARHTCLPF